MTNPFEELAARFDRRMDKIEALLHDNHGRKPATPFPETDRIWNANQVAEFLNTSVGAIYQLVHKGAIPYSKRGKLYFLEKEIRAWIQGGRRQTVGEIQREAIRNLR